MTPFTSARLAREHILELTAMTPRRRVRSHRYPFAGPIFALLAVLAVVVFGWATGRGL